MHHQHKTEKDEECEESEKLRTRIKATSSVFTPIDLHWEHHLIKSVGIPYFQHKINSKGFLLYAYVRQKAGNKQVLTLPSISFYYSQSWDEN